MKQPENALEYWDLIKIIAPQQGLDRNPVWHELSAQINTVIEQDTEKTIKAIIALPFPKSLGLVDSREYDTFCAHVIEGLQKVIRDTGKEPEPLPPNAPGRSRQVVSGMMSYYDYSGTARASTAYDKEVQEEMRKKDDEMEKLDSTEACKEALAKHYASTPGANDPKAWKRKKKLQQEHLITRVFECPKAKLTASVIFDSEADEDPFYVVEEEVTAPTPGKFSKVYGPDRTGEVYFSMGNIEPDYIDFYCGPQVKAGHLDDLNDPGLDKTLEELFKGYDFELAAAENFHIIKPKSGQSVAELKDEIIKKIVGAGAIDFSEPNADLDLD